MRIAKLLEAGAPSDRPPTPLRLRTARRWLYGAAMSPSPDHAEAAASPLALLGRFALFALLAGGAAAAATVALQYVLLGLGLPLFTGEDQFAIGILLAITALLTGPPAGVMLAARPLRWLRTGRWERTDGGRVVTGLGVPALAGAFLGLGIVFSGFANSVEAPAVCVLLLAVVLWWLGGRYTFRETREDRP